GVNNDKEQQEPAMSAAPTTTNLTGGGRVPPRIGLSAKLFALTILSVMIAEIFIYVPSIANRRLVWIQDRLAAAHTAALVLDAAPSGMVPETLAQQILDSIGARQVAMKIGHTRRLLATSEMTGQARQKVDVREVTAFRAIIDAFETLFFCRDHDLLQAMGPA